MNAYLSALQPDLPAASVVISVAFMLFFGFLATRVTKRLKLPDVTAYILAGILLGPFVLNLVPARLIEGMDFLPDIALAFIAFSTGEFFKWTALRKNGWNTLMITLIEAILTSVAVFAASYFLLHLDFAFALVLAALASATAPASTMMTIRQTRSKGDFVDTLLQVVALDDAVGLILYSVAIAVAAVSSAGGGRGIDAAAAIRPVVFNAVSAVLGGLFGWIMKLLISVRRSTDNRLIISIALLFTFCGVCALLNVSPLLGCMAMGTVYYNLTSDDKLFRQLNYFSPPLLLLFFVRSGMSFRLDTLFSRASAVGGVSLIVAGVVYFAVRILGKYAGAYVGCLAAGKPDRVRRYLGLALIPQAGVAIGLAALGARTLGGEAGNALQTLILASSVLYELIGPASAKLGLYLSRSYSTKIEEIVPASDLAGEETPRSDVQLLIDRIQIIQAELPPKNVVSEDEEAFLEAAEEEYAVQASRRRNPRSGRGKR